MAMEAAQFVPLAHLFFSLLPFNGREGERSFCVGRRDLNRALHEIHSLIRVQLPLRFPKNQPLIQHHCPNIHASVSGLRDGGRD